MRIITNKEIVAYKNYLAGEEKSSATISKYLHDVSELQIWLSGKEITKSAVVEYKEKLSERYLPASVNAALSSLNSFFNYMQWFDLRVKKLKIQKQIFSSADKELSKAEYERLLKAARQKKNERLTKR